jgi:hypothetical protein
MKTIGTLAVQAILTFDTEGQDLINTQVLVPTVLTLRMEELTDVEVDVVEQVLRNYAEETEARGEARNNLDQLVKVSLCYTTPPSADTGLQRAFRFLIRNDAKYYFQPNQRSFVESALMERIPYLATKTAAFN